MTLDRARLPHLRFDAPCEHFSQIENRIVRNEAFTEIVDADSISGGRQAIDRLRRKRALSLLILTTTHWETLQRNAPVLQRHQRNASVETALAQRHRGQFLQSHRYLDRVLRRNFHPVHIVLP
jgi:hypothetical protein